MMNSAGICGSLVTGLLVISICSPSPGQTEQDETKQTLILTSEEVGPYRPEHDPDLAQVRQLIVDQTNVFRESEELKAIERDDRLDASAQQFAEYMARNDRYGHRADGHTPADRVRRHDYSFCLIAENIAYHFATESFPTQTLAEQATQGWIDSPGHRRNMLKPHVTEIGVGVAQSESTGVFYAVQLFGRPESARIAFQITNLIEQPVTYLVGEQEFELPPRARRLHQVCLPPTLQLAGSPDTDKQQQKEALLTPEDNARYRVSLVDGQPRLVKGE